MALHTVVVVQSKGVSGASASDKCLDLAESTLVDPFQDPLIHRFNVCQADLMWT